MSTGYANNNEIKNILVKLQEKTATANGEVKPDSGYDGLSKVNVNVEGGGSGGTGLPITINTGSDMDAFVITENIGKIALYTGEGGKYTNGTLYLIEEV